MAKDPAGEALVEELLWHDFVTKLILDRVRQLSLLFGAGAPASRVPVALDAIDPWQTSGATAVEAVELCSCSLLFQRSWCVHGLVDTS